MSFLTLTQGDSVGKGLLKKLLNARYGTSVPALETLRVTYRGRSQAKLGPVTMWARVDAVATYHFPDQMRWEFKLTAARLMHSSYSTAFDGQTVTELERNKVSVITDPEYVRSARTRAWAETVFFVSPLTTDDRFRVERVEGDTNAFRAYGPPSPEGTDEDGPVALVRLHEDGRLNEVVVERVNPVGGNMQTQRLVASGELARVDKLILPAQIQRYWDTEMAMELSPVEAEINPALGPETFIIQEENLLAVLDEDDDNDHDEDAADRLATGGE
jgi:hypothetical protein